MTNKVWQEMGCAWKTVATTPPDTAPDYSELYNATLCYRAARDQIEAMQEQGRMKPEEMPA